jgi:hypothetical protein
MQKPQSNPDRGFLLNYRSGDYLILLTNFVNRDF